MINKYLLIPIIISGVICCNSKKKFNCDNCQLSYTSHATNCLNKTAKGIGLVTITIDSAYLTIGASSEDSIIEIMTYSPTKKSGLIKYNYDPKYYELFWNYFNDSILSYSIIDCDLNFNGYQATKILITKGTSEVDSIYFNPNLFEVNPKYFTPLKINHIGFIIEKTGVFPLRKSVMIQDCIYTEEIASFKKNKMTEKLKYELDNQ